MDKFTFDYRAFYSSCDKVRDELRVIKTFLDEREKAARKNNWITQADSIKNDLETLETLHTLLDNIENNY